GQPREVTPTHAALDGSEIADQRVARLAVVLEGRLRNDTNRVGAIGPHEVVLAGGVRQRVDFPGIEGAVFVRIDVHGPAGADGGLPGVEGSIAVEVMEDRALDAAGHGAVFQHFQGWPPGRAPEGPACAGASEAVAESSEPGGGLQRTGPFAEVSLRHKGL